MDRADLTDAKPGSRMTLPFRIVEGVESVWYYHLSEIGKNYEPALCGRKEVMHTEIPLSNWNKKGGNVPSSYCTECGRIYNETKWLYGL